MSAPTPNPVPLSEMIDQSIKVISNPTVETFDTYENRGTMRDALIYVGLGALVSGALSFSGGLGGIIGGAISTLAAFFVFVYVVHAFGKSQGGTGTLDQVAYTFSLFWMPLSILSAVAILVLTITIVGILLIPALLLATLAAMAYFGYIGVQSSMNLPKGSNAIVTLVVAVIATAITYGIITSII
jgi:Yip1 domain